MSYNLDNKQAVSVLKRIVNVYNENIRSVERKRSWRPSEKAMSIADFLEKKAALELAIAALEQAPGIRVKVPSFDEHAEAEADAILRRN